MEKRKVHLKSPKMNLYPAHQNEAGTRHLSDSVVFLCAI